MGRTVGDQMKQRVKTSKKKKTVSGQMFVSSGSTPFDLALSGSVEGGFPMGKIVNVIGDSHAGKTLLALTSLACAANDKRFDNYNLVYDDVEAADEFDKQTLFGKKASKRILQPVDSHGKINHSNNVEDFEASIQTYLAQDKPFIYVLDSFDSLTAEEEQEASKKNSKAHQDGKKQKGTYGLSKPKFASRFLRIMKTELKQNNSLLIVVSQTRDDINPMTRSTKTRSGGKALKFYSTQEVWLAVVEKKKDSKYKRIVSTKTRAKVTKSKITGKVREADSVLFYDYGIDNVLSMINFLVDYNFWKKSGQSVKAVDFDVSYSVKKLVRFIEDENLEEQLKQIVQKAWDVVEDAIRVNKDRKRRFQ